MTEDTNRRVAPNKLSVLNMVPYRDGGINSWYFEGYSGSNNGVLESFTALAPYSDDIEYETDLNATLNPFTDFDFFVNDLWLSNDSLEEGSSPKVFAEGDTIYLMPELANGSALNFPEGRELVYNITVTEKDSGTVIFTEKEAYTGGIEPVSYTHLSASYPDDGQDLNTLVAVADKQMYKEKNVRCGRRKSSPCVAENN